MRYEAVLGFGIIIFSLIPISYFFLGRREDIGKRLAYFFVCFLDILVLLLYARIMVVWGMLLWDLVFRVLVSLVVMNGIVYIYWKYRPIRKAKFFLYGIFVLCFIWFGLFFIFPEIVEPLFRK